MTNNISDVELENNYEYDCDPDLSFLSVNDLNSYSFIYPNPGENYIYINSNKLINQIYCWIAKGN